MTLGLFFTFDDDEEMLLSFLLVLPFEGPLPGVEEYWRGIADKDEHFPGVFISEPKIDSVRRSYFCAPHSWYRRLAQAKQINGRRTLELGGPEAFREISWS